MGARGPAPTPTRVLKIRGTYRPDRHGAPNDELEMELLEALPAPPSFFDAIARFEWNRVGPELIEKGLLAKVDLAAFTLYCTNIARVAECERVMQVRGMTMITFNGVECARPEVSIARQCGAEVRRFAQEFGMTPSARRRVRAESSKSAPEDSGNEFEATKAG